MNIEVLKSIATAVASDSKCVSLQVGCVIVKDGHIISTGRNGTAKGDVNCCDKFSERGPEHSAWSEKFELHAEVNAVVYCETSIKGSVAVVTHSPCFPCVRTLVAAGVKGVYYIERYYRQSDEDFAEAEEYCKRMGVEFKEV